MRGSSNILKRREKGETGFADSMFGKGPQPRLGGVAVDKRGGGGIGRCFQKELPWLDVRCFGKVW